MLSGGVGGEERSKEAGGRRTGPIDLSRLMRYEDPLLSLHLIRLVYRRGVERAARAIEARWRTWRFPAAVDRPAVFLTESCAEGLRCRGGLG